MLYFNIENRETFELWSVPQSMCDSWMKAMAYVAEYCDEPKNLVFVGISGDNGIDALAKHIEDNIKFAKEMNAHRDAMMRAVGAVEFYINHICTDRYEKKAIGETWDDYYRLKFMC